jgi:hypothetical protein
VPQALAWLGSPASRLWGGETARLGDSTFSAAERNVLSLSRAQAHLRRPDVWRLPALRQRAGGPVRPARGAESHTIRNTFSERLLHAFSRASDKVRRAGRKLTSVIAGYVGAPNSGELHSIGGHADHRERHGQRDKVRAKGGMNSRPFSARPFRL